MYFITSFVDTKVLNYFYTTKYFWYFFTFFAKNLVLLHLFGRFAEKNQKTETKMALRVKELCKERGMTIKDIAQKLGMDASNLSGSIKGNPKLSTLQDVARALDVEVYDLFERKVGSELNGYVEVGGEIYKISNTLDWVEVSTKIDKLAEPHLYKRVDDMRREVGSFVRECVKSGRPASMMGRLLAGEVFALLFDGSNKLFYLALLTRPQYNTYDLCDYGCNGEYDLDGDGNLIDGILNDIESVFEVQ